MGGQCSSVAGIDAQAFCADDVQRMDRLIYATHIRQVSYATVGQNLIDCWKFSFCHYKIQNNASYQINTMQYMYEVKPVSNAIINAHEKYLGKFGKVNAWLEQWLPKAEPCPTKQTCYPR